MSKYGKILHIYDIKNGSENMARDVLVTAGKINRRKKVVKRAKIISLCLLLLLTIVFVILSVIYKGGQFIITLDPNSDLETSLVIYDKLMPKDITGGKKIVGTGTIDIEGNVGRIGGIKEKLGAANKKKADVVFVPKDNYKEAKKLYDKNGYKFKLISVEKFDDAVSFLEK